MRWGRSRWDDEAEQEPGLLAMPTQKASGGLLGVPSSLADQLRAQYSGDWNISGIDRAQELAGILQGRGVTSLDGLQIGGGRKSAGYTFSGPVLNESGEEGPPVTTDATEDGRFLDFGGGVTVGNFSRPDRDMFGSQSMDHPNEFGWSAAGKGNVSYSAMAGPDGRVQLRPAWGSSSDAADIRPILAGLATVLTAGAAGGAFAGAGAAGGGAGAGLGAFEGIGGAMASGGAPMTAAQFSAGVGAAGAGIAPMTAAELAVSAAPYVNTLTPQVMAAGIPDIAGMALTGGAGGAASSMFANEGAAQLGQFSTANPVTQAAVNSAALGPTGNLLGGAAAVTPTTFDALRAAEKANMGQVAGNVPSGVDLGSLGGVMQTAPGINPTTFEELRAAEHADMGQAAGNVPKTVNMGDLGGTTGTAGGLQGAIDVAKQVGGDALSSVAGPAGDMASWMKSNPALGRLVMSGAMGLLSGAGGSSGGGSGGPKTYGPAQKWTSPIQRGLLSDPQQMNPAAITQRSPQGLLAQGQQYDGAWRYMGGK